MNEEVPWSDPQSANWKERVLIDELEHLRLEVVLLEDAIRREQKNTPWHLRRCPKCHRFLGYRVTLFAGIYCTEHCGTVVSSNKLAWEHRSVKSESEMPRIS